MQAVAIEQVQTKILAILLQTREKMQYIHSFRPIHSGMQVACSLVTFKWLFGTWLKFVRRFSESLTQQYIHSGLLQRSPLNHLLNVYLWWCSASDKLHTTYGLR